MLRLLLIGLLATASVPALAVYKCQAGGSVTYSDTPCPGAKELKLDTQPLGSASRSEKQVAEDKKTLMRLERERRRDDAEQEKDRRRTAKARAAEKKKCASLARREQWAREDAASALGKTAEKAKLRARRATQQYEEECGSRDSASPGLIG